MPEVSPAAALPTRVLGTIQGDYVLSPASGFVVLAHPRSGSSVLIQSLREHPSLRIYGELFQDEPEARAEASGPYPTIYRDGVDGAAFLSEQIFCECGDEEVLSIGFKLFHEQARNDPMATAWDYVLGRKDLKIVHLYRENGLATYLSLVEAQSSSQWVLEEGEEPAALRPVRLDPEACRKFLDSLVAYRDWGRMAFGQHKVLELSYERHLLTDFDGTLRDVQTYLELPQMRLPPMLRRQGTRPISERIANYEEIRAALRHTVHAVRDGT